ncbi:DddA-like double-stranded DNA deaminase toxin [Kribbella sp. NPDC056345]|uniref:DddA-like double-stranded DNA deaminase toxin n=1 Tax=Kribbella sp. NPDC056345 TaxID=3345789 RepID=UPI0035E2FF72
MPSELQRVAQQLLATLDEIPRVVAYLHERAGKYRESAGWIGSMSSNQNAQRAAMQLDEAARRCEEAAHYLLQAHARGRSWVEQMVSGVRTAEPAGGSTVPRPLGPGGSPPAAERRQNEDEEKPETDKPRDDGSAGDDDSPKDTSPTPRISDDEGHRLQRKLPVRDETGPTRQKTRGTWVDNKGREQPLTSGQTDFYERVDQFLRERGVGDERGDLMVSSHVELKFAMFMRLNKLKHETIMVNKLPCDGQWGCEELLGDVLPDGATLTIFGPGGFKQTYPLPKDE